MSNSLNINQSRSQLALIDDEGYQFQENNMFVFVVLEIMRYYPGKQYRRKYGLDHCYFWDAFDVTITDKRYKKTFVLTADERFKKELHPGSVIKINKYSKYPYKASAYCQTVIEELEVVNGELYDITDLKKLPWIPSHFSRQEKNLPLASDRDYYVNNWTFALNFDKLKVDEVLPICMREIDLTKVHSLQDVVNKKAPRSKDQLLIVKVMRKSNVIHFFSPFYDDEWPFQLPLVVADHTGWCTAVLWNKLAVELFNNFQEGSLLMIKHFKIKESFQKKSQYFQTPPQGNVVFDSEICLNQTSVVRVIHNISDADVERLKMPDLECCLITRRDLISVPDFAIVDVAGCVTFVGRIEREPRKDIKYHQKDSGGFYHRRWIHLKDKSLHAPTVVLIYEGYQSECFFNISPGQHLLCRHMLTNHGLSTLQSSRQQRYTWLTTTSNSRIYTVRPSDYDQLPKPLDTVVRNAFTEYRKDEFVNLYMEGGFFTYPPLPCTMEAFIKAVPKYRDQITESGQLLQKFNRMNWRQCHQLVVEAAFLSLNYVDLNKQKKSVINYSHYLCIPYVRINDTSCTKFYFPRTQESEKNELGSIDRDCISQLWSKQKTGNRSRPKCAVVFKWHILNEPITLNTIKPIGLCAESCITECKELISGIHDSDLGLLHAAKFDLNQEEVTAINHSSVKLVQSKFTLLLDVYTDAGNGQLIVLKRGFEF
ncbi:unnamed protein product [Lymnaea stagnalis]|uniref:Uncharacterized protein n=1 Tax=Lymnaea stagnalis TaxID=6523 RepID=A0AAV2INU7_LYMST